MSWYKTGSVSVTKGSSTVIGIGTAWVSGTRVGDMFETADGKSYRVSNVASDTAISIDPPYKGASASNLEYQIIPVQGYTKELVDKAAILVNDFVDAPRDAAYSAIDSAARANQSAIDAANSAVEAHAFVDGVNSHAGPGIVAMKTPKGQLTYMFRLPAYNCEDIDPTGGLGEGLFPAFLFNGDHDNDIYISAFPASLVNGEAVSQPNRDPHHTISYDDSRALCRALGAGWDITSTWDWAAATFWCMANGFEPRGNTDYGRHHESKFETAVRVVDGRPGDNSVTIGRTLTGTGPASWSHNNTPNGIYDLVGNVSEWNSGLILRDNLFEIAPDNGIYDEEDYIKTLYESAVEGIFSTREYVDPPLILKQALAVPATGLAPLGRYYRNAEDERLARRGGHWSNAGSAGFGYLDFYYGRSARISRTGFRLRFRYPKS